MYARLTSWEHYNPSLDLPYIFWSLSIRDVQTQSQFHNDTHVRQCILHYILIIYFSGAVAKWILKPFRSLLSKVLCSGAN